MKYERPAIERRDSIKGNLTAILSGNYGGNLPGRVG